MSELRVNRLAEQIKKEITYVLATKVKNHDLGFVTVTEVALTGDYSQAKVYYTVLGGECEKEKTKESFKKIKGFVKSEVAKKIKDILGVNEDQFGKICMIAQGAFAKFLFAKTPRA